MCTSPGEIYAWIGSILIHLSFITIILWSATSAKEQAQHNDVIWKVGFACSAVYAALLFSLARWLEGKCEEMTISATEQATPLTQDATDTNAQESFWGQRTRRVQILFVNLLYGAAVLAVGLPGCFVALQAIDCCQSDAQMRIRDAVALGLVSLPITLVSIWLWNRKQQLSSMVATTLIGVSLLLRNICILIDPHLDVIAVGTFLVGALWVLFVTRLYLLTTPQHTDNDKFLLHFGLTLGAVVYFCGACQIFLPHFNVHQATFGHLMGASFLCFVPLALLGVGTDCFPLPLLGALGLFLDALYLAYYLSHKCPTFGIPIKAAVLAVTGLAIGALGLVLDGFKQEIKFGMEQCFSCCRLDEQRHHDNTELLQDGGDTPVDDEETDRTTPLITTSV